MFSYITFLSAIVISLTAIFFSVTGLMAIFAAAPIPVAIMGTSIELGKLVAVIWLHKYWNESKLWLRYALVVMIVVVMFITSLGIFGGLSKSHVEQTAQSQENVAQVQRIKTEIARYTAIIARSEQKIQGFEDNGGGVDASLNRQIDNEQTRIDTAYDRVKSVIQVQLDIIAADEVKTDARAKPYQTELTAINQQLDDLQAALSNKQIRTAQGIVGTQPDGLYKEKTQAAIKEFRTRNEARRDTLLEKIDAIRGTPSPAASNAKSEINRIHASAQNEINESNATIKNLRSRMGKTNDIETLITDERAKIKRANTELDALIETKYTLEASYRKLEAEVGPLKYIAEFVSNKAADATSLERAVQWLIIIIIFVFDPFAVFLLIAAQHSFDKGRKERLAARKMAINDETLAKIDDIVQKAENVLHEAETVEHNLEDLLKDYPDEPLTDEDRDWLGANPVGQEFGSDDFEFEPEPIMPKNETDSEHENNHNHEWGDDSKAPAYEDYYPEEEITTEFEDVIKPPISTHASAPDKIALTKVANNYINYNGKVYQTAALMQAYPALGLNFDRQVKSGIVFPLEAARGTMMLRTDETPTQLYICNGVTWDAIDKNILNFAAYSHEYIKAVIKRVGNAEYNPVLLNEAEKKHIEDLLGKE